MTNEEFCAEPEHDTSSFAGIKQRLDEIVTLVSDDTMPLDDALKLYEEAVDLGLAASNLLEQGIPVDAEDTQGAEDAESMQDIKEPHADAQRLAEPFHN